MSSLLRCNFWPKFHVFHDSFDEILDMQGLTQLERNIIRNRYQKILRATSFEYNIAVLSLMLLMNAITIGSVLVVTFLSIQKSVIISDQASTALFWTTVILSVLVVIASKLII